MRLFSLTIVNVIPLESYTPRPNEKYLLLEYFTVWNQSKLAKFQDRNNYSVKKQSVFSFDPWNLS